MTTSIRKLTGIVNAFRGKRLVVVGDWMLDRYVWGKSEKLSPEAPVPVVDHAGDDFKLGGAGNVGANLAALGAKVAPFGVTGKDDAASDVLKLLDVFGMPHAGLLMDDSRPTTTKTRVIASHPAPQQIVRIDREKRHPISSEIQEKLIRTVMPALRTADALVVSDYDKGVVTDELASRILSASAKLKKPAFVKPKWSVLAKYPGATCVVVNRKEAEFLTTQKLHSMNAVNDAGRQLLEKYGCSIVVITLGGEGMWIVEQDAGRGHHVPATSEDHAVHRFGQSRAGGKQVFDVTGAGDTVLATLALAIASGAAIREAAILASCAAGVVVGKLGTATVSPEELTVSLKDLI